MAEAEERLGEHSSLAWTVNAALFTTLTFLWIRH